MTTQNTLSETVAVLRSAQPFSAEIPRCAHYITGRHIESVTEEASLRS